jgi:hypothetical protein
MARDQRLPSRRVSRTALGPSRARWGRCAEPLSVRQHQPVARTSRMAPDLNCLRANRRPPGRRRFLAAPWPRVRHGSRRLLIHNEANRPFLTVRHRPSRACAAASIRARSPCAARLLPSPRERPWHDRVGDAGVVRRRPRRTSALPRQRSSDRHRFHTRTFLSGLTTGTPFARIRGPVARRRNRIHIGPGSLALSDFALSAK